MGMRKSTHNSKVTHRLVKVIDWLTCWMANQSSHRVIINHISPESVRGIVNNPIRKCIPDQLKKRSFLLLHITSISLHMLPDDPLCMCWGNAPNIFSLASPGSNPWYCLHRKHDVDKVLVVWSVLNKMMQPTQLGQSRSSALESKVGHTQHENGQC